MMFQCHSSFGSKSSTTTSSCYFYSNDKLAHALNDGRQYELRIDMLNKEREHRYAKYSHFRVAPRSDNYYIRISGYSGNAGVDAFGDHQNGQPFTTFDVDLDQSADYNCAAEYGGGFWFNNCFYFFPNGPYDRMYWDQGGGDFTPLKKVSMAFRATN